MFECPVLAMRSNSGVKRPVHKDGARLLQCCYFTVIKLYIAETEKENGTHLMLTFTVVNDF